MSLISVQNLTFGYEGSRENVFENTSFVINTDWRLGLVGRNGRGKTTLLKILKGEYTYSGRITASAEFDYFPFAVKDAGALSIDIIGEICPSVEEWKIFKELSLLSVDEAVLYLPFCKLSNGERTKLLLAALLLKENNFLLIDEPTNHLDAQAREAVARYLQRKKGFIVVSHDRAFLDGCIDHVISINKTDIEIQSGSFSSYLRNFQLKQEFETAQNEKLKKDIARLTESAKRISDWSDKTEASKFKQNGSGLKNDRGYIGHKSAKMMKRAKATENRKQQAIIQKSELLKNTENADRITISPLKHHSSRLLTLSDVAVFYGDRKICSGVSFEVEQGDRIALDGKNGSGKSSILKLIWGEDIAHTGTVNLASGLIISYVPQSADGLSGTLSQFAEDMRADESLFKTLLVKMGFDRADFNNDIAELSQGQKKKVLLCASLCQRAHLYIWDEPLNYMDIYSRLQIENLLLEYSPTMIFIEHDSAFRASVATETVFI